MKDESDLEDRRVTRNGKKRHQPGWQNRHRQDQRDEDRAEQPKHLELDDEGFEEHVPFEDAMAVSTVSLEQGEIIAVSSVILDEDTEDEVRGLRHSGRL